MSNPWFNDEQMGGHTDRAPDPLPSVPPEKPMSELDKEIEAAKRRTLEGFTRVVDTVSASPLPEEPRECPACGTKLIPAAQAFSKIRERITVEPPRDFAEEMRERAGADAHARNHAAEEPREGFVTIKAGGATSASPLPEEPTEIKEALIEVQRTGQALLGHDTVRIVPDMAERARANDKARSRVFALFGRQREEIRRLESSNDQYEESLEERHAEIERLKAEQLTAEEAMEILDDSNLCARLEDVTVSKLHRMAQSDTGAKE